MDWTTSKSSDFDQQMLCKSASLKRISGAAMIVGLKIMHLSLEHYTMEMFSNVFSSFSHIPHFRRTVLLDQYASQTQNMAEYTAK
jgi:hypothetical protein